MEDNLLYSKSTDLNVNLMKNILISEPISGHHDPTKLTHKMNHHSIFQHFDFGGVSGH